MAAEESSKRGQLELILLISMELGRNEASKQRASAEGSGDYTEGARAGKDRVSC
mgnify:CR=1 FL=1